MRPPDNGKNGFHFFRKKGCHYLLLIPLLMASRGTNAQTPAVTTSPVMTQTLTYSQASLEISDAVGGDNVAYSKVKYAGLRNADLVPGNPSLPVQYVRLIVPRDKNYSAITIEAQEPVIIDLPQQVYPVQHPVPINDEPVAIPFAGPDPEIYNADAPTPSVLVKYMGEGYFDGNKHIITVAVYPVRYLPGASRLEFYSSITFHVAEDPDVPLTMHSISRNPVALQDLYDKPLLQGMVANTDDIPLFANMSEEEAAVAAEAAAAAKGTAAFYEYVVITSHEMRPAFEELVGWKRRKGLNAGIVEIQDILSDPAYSSGDLISGINDDAGKLRQYLTEAYQNGTVYALFGGDRSVIPIRYADANYNGVGGPESIIPGDLYFSDLTGNWNTDGDTYYGERIQDNVDYNPEMFVGRMLVNKPIEAVNHIHKVIRYERNPGRGDNEYLDHAFMTQADQMMDGNEAGLVAAELTFYPSGNINIWNESPGPGNNPASTSPDPTDVINEINKHYGLVSLMGHGNAHSIAVVTGAQAPPNDFNGCPKKRVSALDSYGGLCTTPQSGDGLDNLDDFNHVQHPYHNFPHIFYTGSCETMPYDDYGKTAGLPDMGEAYTKYHKAGAAAYLGNTREGWAGESYKLFIEFAKLVVQGNAHLGVAEGLSKPALFAGFPWGWCEKTHNLVGCPETEMWTAKPASFTGATVSGSGGTVTVSTGGITDATICIISELDNGQTYQQRVNSVSGYTFTGVPARYAVCITKHDYIPFLWQQNVLVQNHNFTQTAYVAAPNDIAAGQNVDRNQSTGPVIVKKDANVFFHADNKGTILLDKGFEVEPGAAFEAK